MKELDFEEINQEERFVGLIFFAFDMIQGEFYYSINCKNFDSDVFPCLVPEVLEF